MGTWAAAGHLFTTCHRERGGGQQGSDHRSGSRLGVLIYACNCYLSSLQGDQQTILVCCVMTARGEQEFNTAINNRCEYWLTQPPHLFHRPDVALQQQGPQSKYMQANIVHCNVIAFVVVVVVGGHSEGN